MLDARRARARREKRTRPVCNDGNDEVGEVDTDAAGAVPSHEDAVLDHLTLVEALRTLSPKHREALDLVCYHGFSVAEAAVILDVPPGTIKSRLSYARRALSGALRKGDTFMNTDAAGALTCSACRDALSEYVTDVCAPHVRMRIAAHLDGCSACRDEARRWMANVSAVRQPQLGDHPLPGSLPRILSSVLARHVDGGSSSSVLAADNIWSARIMAPHMQTQIETQLQLGDTSPPSTPNWPPRDQRRPISALASLAAVLLIALLAGLLLAHGPGGKRISEQLDADVMPLTTAELRGLDLRAVAQVSPDEGWAVGGTVPDPSYDILTAHKPYISPILIHYLRGRWYRVHVPTDLPTDLPANYFNWVGLEDLKMLSPDEGWAVGSSRLPPNADGIVTSYLLHYHNGTWRVDTVVQNAHPTRLTLFSPTDGWAVGDLDSTGAATVLHYDGTKWRLVGDTIFHLVTLTAVGGTSPSDLWAAGIRQVSVTGPEDQGFEPIFLHFDGAHWTQQGIRAGALPIRLRIAGLAMASSTDGWAVGTVIGGMTPSQPPSAVVLRFQAGSWTQLARYVAPADAGVFALNAVAVIAKGDGWAVGTSGLRVRIHGGRVTPDVVPSSVVAQPDLQIDLRDVAISSSDDGWAVGDHGTLLRYDGARWQTYTP